MEADYADRPVTDSFFGIKDGVTLRGGTQLYVPKKFGNINCIVHKLQHTFLNISQLSLDIEFSLEGDMEIRDIIDKSEAWKLDTMRNFFSKAPSFLTKRSAPLPIAGFMLNKFLSVKKVVDVVKNEEIPFDQAIDTVFSFESPKPTKTLGVGEVYSYYDKKTTFVYDDLEFGKTYKYRIILQSEAVHFEFGLLFPFGNVVFEEMNSSSDSGNAEFLTCITKISPCRSESLPENLLEQLERRLPENFGKVPRYPTHIKPALPSRGEEILFPPNGTYGLPDYKSPDEVPNDFGDDLENITGYETEKFEAIRFTTSVTIGPDENLDIVIKHQEKPIPTRIYDQLQKMQGYQDVFVSFDIVNLGSKRRRVRVEAEVPGYTDIDKKIVSIHGISSKNGRKARERVFLCPRLKRGAMESIVNVEKGTLIAKVFDEDTKGLLLEETHPIEFLPSDTMVFSIQSMQDSLTHDLSNFLASWVYPRDKEGKFDVVRVGSAKYHPDGSIFYDGTIESLLEHIKAVYEYLSTDEGMIYVNQPFNIADPFDAQRVVIPEVSLRNKAGNCIDLTVLFASLLEGFGISSHVFLTKDHAFIGWGDPRSVKTLIALETTFIGKHTFEEAIKMGKEHLLKNFVFVGAQDIGPLDITYHILGSKIVSIKKSREQGIISSL